jgi:murein DD-endopeptidase MepM/ murein hydrolase activator NlpD
VAAVAVMVNTVRIPYLTRMLRPVLLGLAAALLAAPVAHGAQVGLPSHEAPNGPGSIIVPFSMSRPPAQPERRAYGQLLELWKGAGAAYGVPWEVLAAINKVESDFGRNTGPSSAGALGWMQFMPSTWMRWGLDADGDGVANPWDPEDAIYAAARYLAAAGAQEDLYRAVYAYNHADWYVRDVLALAQVFAGGGGFDATLGSPLGLAGGDSGAGAAVMFEIDSLEQRLADARKLVNSLQQRVVRAERAVARLETAVYAAEQHAGSLELSDAEFRRVEAEVTRLVVARERAVERLATLQAKRDEAAALAETLRQAAEIQANAITFSQPVADALGAAQFSGRYVFPVGGGPSVVSVSPEHHDYPAADIAAPEGSPLYALADSVVTRSFPSPHGKCGIGFELRLADGRRYLYCHLSYLEGSVVPGAALSAGTPVGLVGETGNATGPHLHLQLVPATEYPQQEPWFRSFAGLAFDSP